MIYVMRSSVTWNPSIDEAISLVKGKGKRYLSAKCRSHT